MAGCFWNFLGRRHCLTLSEPGEGRAGEVHSAIWPASRQWLLPVYESHRGAGAQDAPGLNRASLEGAKTEMGRSLGEDAPREGEERKLSRSAGQLSLHASYLLEAHAASGLFILSIAVPQQRSAVISAMQRWY